MTEKWRTEKCLLHFYVKHFSVIYRSLVGSEDETAGVT
jgi:hypothetical protein